MGVLELIKAAQTGDTVWDRGEKASARGLHVRCLETKKMFYLSYRSREGIQRRPKIGEFGQITLTQARSIAKDLRERVSRGEDPQEKWSKARAGETLADLFQLAWDLHWSLPRYIESGWANDVRNLWEKNIKPKFGSRSFKSITTQEVRRWHRGFASKPFAGNRSLETFAKMYSFGAEEGIVEGINPCWKIKGHPERKRRRYASEQELRAITGILEREMATHPREAAFLLLIAYTGARPSVLERAKSYQMARVTSDSGEEFGVLTGDGKSSADTGEEETVIIPPNALRIIDAIPKNQDGRIVGCMMPRKLWLKVRKEAGCEDLWARDLRRTFATVGMSGGVNKDIIGKLLNHSASQTTDIYAKLDLTARIKAAGQIADRITQIGKVIPLR